jgi:DNA-binding Lrp family transcriptional regulator
VDTADTPKVAGHEESHYFGPWPVEGTANVTTDERRRAVQEILADNPQATQRQIAARLGCSQASVRRDVAALRRDSVVTQAAAQGVSAQFRSRDSERLVAALNAELAEAARAGGHELAWSAAEADVIGMLAAGVDRRVELSAQYAACDNVNVKLKIATELRLLEQSIARLYRQVSTEVAAPRSMTSLKASRAAHSRWDRERMKQQSGSVAT